MSTDLYTSRPTNLRARGVTHVTSDLYDICARVKELDPRLFIVYHETNALPYTVMEHCADGVDRIVRQYATLDARVLESLRYMLNVPFAQRWRVTADEVDRHNADSERMSEEALEKFAFEFDRAARRSNLYDPVWDKSFAKVQVKK